jgi:hypothetical protein
MNTQDISDAFLYDYTSCLSFLMLMAQPMTIRENRSIITAKYAKPFGGGGVNTLHRSPMFHLGMLAKDCG